MDMLTGLVVGFVGFGLVLALFSVAREIGRVADALRSLKDKQ